MAKLLSVSELQFDVLLLQALTSFPAFGAGDITTSTVKGGHGNDRHKLAEHHVSGVASVVKGMLKPRVTKLHKKSMMDRKIL